VGAFFSCTMPKTIYKVLALCHIIWYNVGMSRKKCRLRMTIYMCLLPVMFAGVFGCAKSAEQTEQPTVPAQSNDTLVISEAMSSNTSLAVAELGTPDWIELTNVSDAEISLRGWQLTDDLEKKSRCALPDETLAAGESLLLYAISGEVPTVASDLMVADFSLSKDGETLYLIAPDQTLAAELVFPALPADISYARRSDTFDEPAMNRPRPTYRSSLSDDITATAYYTPQREAEATEAPRAMEDDRVPPPPRSSVTADEEELDVPQFLKRRRP